MQKLAPKYSCPLWLTYDPAKTRSSYQIRFALKLTAFLHDERVRQDPFIVPEAVLPEPSPQAGRRDYIEETGLGLDEPEYDEHGRRISYVSL
jgi:hypothetical protein